MEGEAAVGTVPCMGPHFIHVHQHTNLLLPPVHSLTCPWALPPSFLWGPGGGPGQVAAYCILKEGLPGPLCNETRASTGSVPGSGLMAPTLRPL